MPVQHRLLFLSILGLLVIGPLYGQDRLDPSTMGTARSSVSYSRGLASLQTNPGGLDYLPLHSSTLGHDLVFSIYTIGGTIGGTYLKGSEFSSIFGGLGEGASDASRERIGELLVDERLYGNAGVNFISGIWHMKNGGTLGVHYGSRGYARINFPDDLANLIATSNIAAKDFRFVNRGIGVTWLTEFGLSYGRVFGEQNGVGWFRSVGVGLKARAIGGVVSLDVDENSAIYVDQINVNGQLQFLVRGGYTVRNSQPDSFDQVKAVSNFLSNPFPATSGLGFGVDLGISGLIYQDAEHMVHYGLALDNVGTIGWTKNATLRVADGFRDTIGATLSNETFNRFQGVVDTVDSYSTPLPTTMRGGFGVTLVPDQKNRKGTVTFAVEGEVPLNQVPGNTPDPKISAGVEWSAANQLTLRSGLSVGGISDVGLGLGLGIHPTDWMSLDVGTSELNGLFSGNRLDFAARLSFGLNLNE